MEETVQEPKKGKAERKVEMLWDGLSEILVKSGGFIPGEKIKEITLMNPKRIKFIVERKA